MPPGHEAFQSSVDNEFAQPLSLSVVYLGISRSGKVR